MHRRPVLLSVVRLAGTVALLLAILSPPGTTAQAPQGATMTVLRGQVAVVHRDGSAVQPAPSGTTVVPGDEIRTVGPSGALITLFIGTEIELGEETVLRVESVSRQGDRIDVSLSQVFGTALHKVASFSDPGSSYRVEAGGAVALVRGTTFLIGYYPPVFVLVVVEGRVLCLDKTAGGPAPAAGDPAARAYVAAQAVPPGQPLGPGGYVSATEPPSCALEQAPANTQDPWSSVTTIRTEKEKDQEDEKDDDGQEDDSGPPNDGEDFHDSDGGCAECGSGAGITAGQPHTTLDLIVVRAREGLDPLTATGTLLFVGAVSWTALGARRRR